MMRLLKTAFHPDVSPADISPNSDLRLIERHAARGIVVKGERILLVYTQRYDDYSLPGGGIDEGEEKVAGRQADTVNVTILVNFKNISNRCPPGVGFPLRGDPPGSFSFVYLC